MRRSLRRSAVVGAAVAILMSVSPQARAQGGDEIGRMIAEEFAKDGGKSLPVGATRIVVPAERPTAADEQRLLEEIDMLERARAEAEARRDELVRVRDAAERDKGKDAEAAAKAEQARRQAEEAERVLAAARKAEEERRLADEQRKAEEAEVAQMETEREAEADRIDEALRKAREARARRNGIEREPYRPSEEPVAERRRIEARDAPPALEERERSGLGVSGSGAHPATNPASSTRVTVLLTMIPGSRGIRRHNKTGDPILCGERGCYISAGADAPADLLPLRRAFGAGRTLGERAGACRNALGCVFRDVDLVAFPAIVQPVDMRFLRHDRRQPQVLHEPSACRLDTDRLACTAIQGPDYTLWVVPEEIAAAAGPSLLERAVEDGLSGPDAPVLRSVRN